MTGPAAIGMSADSGLSLPPPPRPGQSPDSARASVNEAPAEAAVEAPPVGAVGATAATAIEGVWARMRETVLARMDVIDDGVAALVERRLDESTRSETEQAAHKLAGSAGTFSFHEASRLARCLEHRFTGEPDPDDARAAAEEAVALRLALESPAVAVDAAQPSAEAADDHPMVLLLSADANLAERVRRAVAARGLNLCHVDTPDQAHQLVAARVPAAVVLDVQLDAHAPQAHAPGGDTTQTDGVADALSALTALALPPQTPRLLLADVEAQPDRVAAARAGVDRYLSRGAAADEVAATIGERLHSTATARVLACDDDVAVLEAIRAVLGRVGIVVDTVADPRCFWEEMAASPPDLVMLDMSMPHVDGLELCHTLRSDPSYVAVPVVFLTGHTDRDSVQQAFDAGADDVVGKPLVDAELRVRVSKRLERARLLRRLAETDPLTGLANRRASLAALQRLLALSRRHEQPLSLAVVDLDRFKHLNATHGHATADAVLRQLGRQARTQFRAGDVAARWGGDEFVIGMYGMGRHDGVQRVAELLEGLRATTIDDEGPAGAGGTVAATFSAGVAEHPRDGADVDALYRAADRALRRAKQAGGDQVRAVAADDYEEAHGQCDVVVVEDDPAVSELLVHALHTRGYGVEVLDDGGVARRRLVGEAADLRPRVVLLDVDLPALNGLDLLAELQRHEVLERARVVMLTGRSGEDDIVDALRLGAVDHVAKPFSVPELLERVRHALAT